ncbi:hypothetical protein ES708_32602 [subsurface metagenome]
MPGPDKLLALQHVETDPRCRSERSGGRGESVDGRHSLTQPAKRDSPTKVFHETDIPGQVNEAQIRTETPVTTAVLTLHAQTYEQFWEQVLGKGYVPGEIVAQLNRVEII